MARDMSDIDILKMELEQLKKEVSTPREPVRKTNGSIKRSSVALQSRGTRELPCGTPHFTLEKLPSKKTL
uniref:Uncharacterized protein n=1 Tax=Oncorhynchus mykiss TaxID=8022 RepID=A0A8K9WQR2_ONCMY